MKGRMILKIEEKKKKKIIKKNMKYFKMLQEKKRKTKRLRIRMVKRGTV
jgi:hypothetical protein